MTKSFHNKSISIIIVTALVLGLFPSMMMTADAATIYRWDHTVNESTGLYQDTVNSLFIRASDYSGNPRNLTSVSGWLKIFGGYGNSLELEKLPYSTFPNEVFSVKIKSDSGVALVEVKFLDVFYKEISGYNVTVTATTTGSIASLPASSDVYCVRIDSDQEFYITDMVFGNITPSFLGSSDLYLPVSSSSSWDIRNLMRVSDTDTLQTLTWTVSSAPSHGTLTIESATASSGSSYITPGGTILYRPTANYTGSDSFTVEVSDGIASATKTINVTIIEQPQITNMVNDTNVSGDFITSSNDITLIGSATANSTIEMFSGYILHGTTTANSSGYWEYRINPITEGSYSFICSSTLGGVTVFSEEAKTVVIDATAPVTSISNISFSNDSGNSSSDRITKTALQYLNIILDSSLADNEHVEISMDEGSTWTDVSIATGTTTGICSVTLLNGTHTIKGRIADTAGNEGTVSSYSYTLDTSAPTFILSSSTSSNTNKSSIPVSVEFSEEVTGFNNYDISITNAVIDDFSTSDNITYTFNISTNTSVQGDITASISENIAEDNAGNGNNNSSSIAFYFDTERPTLEITSTTNIDTNIYDIPVKFMFSEDVTGFTVEDIVMSNATPKPGSFEAISAREYNVIAVATAAGLVTVDVAVDAAYDSAGNGNVVAEQLFRRFDRIRPSVSVTSTTTAVTSTSPIPITITFSENVTGFTADDITVTNGTKGTLSGIGSTYTINITPAAEGYVYVSIPELAAQDVAGNQSRATTTTFQRIYDYSAPSLVISSSSDTITNTSPIPVTFTFSEAVTGFSIDDISVVNGNLSNFVSVNGYTYTVNVTPSGQGQVTVDVAAGVATDAADNSNTAATQFVRTYDTVSPSVSIDSTVGSSTNVSPFVTITFSEAVTGFTRNDITFIHCMVNDPLYTTDNIVFTVDVYPTLQDTLTINVAAGVTTDAAGNNNTAATEFTRTYDSERPRASISSSAAANVNSSFTANVQFSEVVTGFALDDITVTNGTASNLATTDNRNYSVTITPSDQGIVTVDVATNAAYDAAGNGNTTVNIIIRVYDSVSPTVTIDSSLSSYTNISPIPLTITFSEAVTGFTADDITVTNGTKGTLSGSGSVYTIDITPLAQGAVTVNISSSVAIDVAGNANVAASEFTRVYDTVAPVTTIDIMELNMDTYDSTDFITKYDNQTLYIGLTNRLPSTERVEISMDEGMTWTNFSHAANSYYGHDNITLLNGTHNIKLRIVDLAGNIGSVTTQQYTLDTDRPTVNVTHTLTNPTNQSPIPITITFSEDVIGMQLSDLLIENGTASALLGSGNIYTTQITPSGNGEVRLRMGYGSVMDLAANVIETSSYYTWTYDGTSPSVYITSTASSSTSLSVIPVTITFSETVTGFTTDDITVTNGTKGTLSGSGSIYTIDITPSSQGEVTVGISADVAFDAANNGNTVASTLTRIYDTINPTVHISSATDSLTNVTPIPVTITFSEDVTGFTVNDITVTNGVAGGFVSVSGSVYTALITPAGNGEVIVDVLANTASDRAGNQNSVASGLTRTFDSIRPTAIISSAVSDYTISSSVNLTITFSKNVTGFDISDIVIDNGNASNFTLISNSIYTVDITAVTQGNVTVDVPDGAAEDTAGNTNTAATQLAYIYDNLAPVVGVSTAITIDSTGTGSVRIRWDAATDNISSVTDLLYRAY